jgi:hypothetical protein
MTLCSQIEVYQWFGWSVNLYLTMGCQIPEDNHLHSSHHENLQSHICQSVCLSG